MKSFVLELIRPSKNIDLKSLLLERNILSGTGFSHYTLKTRGYGLPDFINLDSDLIPGYCCAGLIPGGASAPGTFVLPVPAKQPVHPVGVGIVGLNTMPLPFQPSESHVSAAFL